MSVFKVLWFLICSALPLAISQPIHGAITHPFADSPQALSVVAYSRDGRLIDVAPVTKDASFTMHRLGLRDGHYVLHVLGAVREDFDPKFVQITSGRIWHTENRQDPLIIFGKTTSDEPTAAKDLSFERVRKTNYKREKRPWTLKNLWALRARVLQLTAVAFVIWFPQFIRSLPKEIRDELMGETENDLGDAAAIFRALSGNKEPGTGPVISSSMSKR